MDTWNTITQMSRTRLNQALLVLETLCNEDNVSILDMLQEREQMTLADLYMKTGETPSKLQVRLESLCDTGCIVQETGAIGSSYRLNPERIWQINGIGQRINQIREAGIMS